MLQHIKQNLKLLLGALVCCASTSVRAAPVSSTNLYDLKTQSLSGKEISLDAYRGQVVLIVNTASRCGFTGQYQGLESLYQEYKDRGFTVLAFPSNDFGSQEPGSNSEIKDFCDLNYKISFPIFTKAAVTGGSKQPVYKFLTEQSSPKFQGDPGWNFVKFLINRKGEVIGRFSSMTDPMSKKLIRAVEGALGENIPAQQ